MKCNAKMVMQLSSSQQQLPRSKMHIVLCMRKSVKIMRMDGEKKGNNNQRKRRKTQESKKTYTQHFALNVSSLSLLDGYRCVYPKKCSHTQTYTLLQFVSLFECAAVFVAAMFILSVCIFLSLRRSHINGSMSKHSNNSSSG